MQNIILYGSVSIRSTYEQTDRHGYFMCKPIH